jgi:hypothetical protein
LDLHTIDPHLSRGVLTAAAASFTTQPPRQ